MRKVFPTVNETVLLWTRFTWRHWRNRPGSTALLVAILALGVGVFFSIRLANRAAVSGFSLFTETLNGESDLVITSPSGFLDVTVLPQIRQRLGTLPVSFFPILETTATTPSASEDLDGFNAEQYHLVGIDLLALPNLIFLNPPSYRPPVDFANDSSDGSRTNHWTLKDSTRYEIFITKQRAKKDHLSTGDRIDLIINDQQIPFKIAGILPETELSARKPSELVVIDLPRLQELTGRKETIDRIELRIPTGPYYETWLEDATRRLENPPNASWQVEPPQRQRQTGAVMTQAFRLNLTILSGLALIVGIYLILQALEAAVIKRRMEIATLKSLGLTPNTLLRAWLVESLALGLLGSVTGLLLGFLGAQFAVGAIAKTVNSLYFSNTTTAAAWHWGEASMALAVGLLASLVAGWLPARDAATTPPAQVLASGNHSRGKTFLNRPLLGVAAMLIGLIGYFSPPLTLAPGVHFPVGGYVAALTWVISGSILCGLLFPPLASLLGKTVSGSAKASYAASQLRRPSGRHRLTAAGLLVAVGMAAGMSLLIQSFEHTMISWINQALKADLYVAVQGVGNISSANRIRPETWRQLANAPEVAEAEVGQMYPIDFRSAATYLVGASFGDRSGWRHMVWIDEPAVPFADLAHDRSPPLGVINESFQQRFGVRVGETIKLPTPTGPQSVEIVGTFADYGNERGSVVIPRSRLAEWFRDESALNVAAHLKPGVEPDEIRRKWMQAHPGLVVRTNRHLREEVMRVFHETFSVTHALKWIGVTVALIGLGLGLWSILLERRSQLRVLKELGMDRHDIAQTVVIEGLGLAIPGLIGGLILSIALGHLLIYVINYQSFGWTLAFSIPWIDMARLSGGILIIAAGVAYVVGHRCASLPSDREE